MLDSLPVLLITIKDILTSEQISFVGLDTLGLLHKLVAEEEDEVKGNAQVPGDEVLVVKVAVGLGVASKGGKVLGQGNQAAPEKREIGTPCS